MAEFYLMLTLIEDSISESGKVKEAGGVLWRLAATNGWTKSKVADWFKAAFTKKSFYDDLGWCPEAVLQEMGSDWQLSLPAIEESVCWFPNQFFCRLLIDNLGSKGADGGKTLERLAAYLMACMPGTRVKRRVITTSTDLDVFCSIEGVMTDFRQELGRQWICECKDTDVVGFTAVAKFARVLDSSKCKSGVLFTRNRVSGDGEYRWAHQEICRLYQQHGIVIMVIDLDDMKAAAEGQSFLSLLRNRYEHVRHDLWKRVETP